MCSQAMDYSPFAQNIEFSSWRPTTNSNLYSFTKSNIEGQGLAWQQKCLPGKYNKVVSSIPDTKTNKKTKKATWENVSRQLLWNYLISQEMGWLNNILMFWVLINN